jgi:hypothetical protein
VYPPGIACTPARSNRRLARLFARLCTLARPGRPPASYHSPDARELKPGRSSASRRMRSAKMVISRGIWRSIVENPCQKTSKYSPNLTKHRHTKRAGEIGGRHPPKRPIRAGRGEGSLYPRKRVHACTLCMLPRKRSTREHKTSITDDGSDGVDRIAPTQDLSLKRPKSASPVFDLSLALPF